MKFKLRLFITVLFGINIAPLMGRAQGPQISPSGWDSGNAGDAYASEFILTARDILQRLDLLIENQAPVFDTSLLLIAVTTTEVVSENHVFLNEIERDAVNYFPEKRLIKMSRSRWRELRRPTETKIRMRLVLHEYLWISGVDDTNYRTSEHLVELLKVNNYSPTIWWNPVNPVNYINLSLSYSPEGCSFLPQSLDVRKGEEIILTETQGPCGDAFRRIEIVKSSGVTPPASNILGYFHKFDINIFDKANKLLGSMTFEPEWGQCLLPEIGTCRVSGKMTLNGVNLMFWFIRN